MMKFLSGVVVGAAAMYVLDPAKGRGRRSELRDRGRATLRARRRRAEQLARDAANRELGEEAKARGAGHFHPTDDRSVELHLHQVLTELDVDTHDVTVEVYEGLARVRGQVASVEARQRVIATVEASPGVRGVESLLHLPGEPAPNKEQARHAGLS